VQTMRQRSHSNQGGQQSGDRMLRATNGKEQLISKNCGVSMKCAEVIQRVDRKSEKHLPVIVAIRIEHQRY
jgi:hypothetical protein